VPRNAEIRHDHDTPGSIDLGSKPVTSRRRLHTCGPDEGAGFDPVISSRDAILVTTRHHSGEAHFNAEFFQRAPGSLRETLLEDWEEARARLDQEDAGVRRID
jgi:hypothetical protein